MKSINPVTGEEFYRVSLWDGRQLESALQQAAGAATQWAAMSLDERADALRAVAAQLRAELDKYARIITREMGKLYSESKAEVEKCALGCEYYADNGTRFLQNEVIASDATSSYVRYDPLGTVLAVMPWNFPLWQVFRFAAPALMAGNTVVLKHASNVPQCALAIEAVFNAAGLPDGVVKTLLIPSGQVQKVIEDSRVHAVTLTGSEAAGRQVAAHAGAQLKKCVLELGGSDPFIVLKDADIALTVKNAVASRFLNAGQSCIAAKRFIVVDSVAETFVEQLGRAVTQLTPGDPMDPATRLAPMARLDLRDALHAQVQASIVKGAVALSGCKLPEGSGAFYSASLLDQVKPGMPAYDEEVFGPVAAVIRVRNEQEAVRIANDTRYGLGASIWTGDEQRGQALSRHLESGCVFINGLVKSDPRLPFGGVKASGYGRELCHHGIHEFVNAKTVWVA
jgi:succinate-semialdehyde dehydrogenase/glutarate-semialdehyde dehydrogenase